MENFSINAPINSVSFGQVTLALLREIFSRGLEPCLFPIADQIDLSSEDNVSEEFRLWLKSCIEKRHKHHSRENPSIKLWHINGSLESVSKKQLLFTFHETDTCTEEEVNICKNNNECVFSSEYSKNIFAQEKVNCSNIDLGFDSHNFKQKDGAYIKDKIVFNLCGKLEKRKNHAHVIRHWLKKYGNQKDYVLQIAVNNPFLKKEKFYQILNEILEGKSYFNINILPEMKKNSVYNDFLNSGNIILGMSGAEGWGLPEFQSVAIGKHSVILNATGYKQWTNEKNSVLVEPSGKQPIYDNTFFKEGGQFNQGNMFVFEEDSFIEGCEKAIERYKNKSLNEEGLKIQKDFPVSRTVDLLLEKINKCNA